jgi:hypothetical protein
VSWRERDAAAPPSQKGLELDGESNWFAIPMHRLFLFFELDIFSKSD